MKAVFLLAAALLVAGSYASDDPTGSLAGVVDLSELFVWGF
jgi:hypothetical protein